MRSTAGLVFGLLMISLLSNCNIEITEQYDAAAVRAADIQAINEVIAEKGWPEPDTTESGARYLIFSEGDTSRAKITQEDIVYFDYIGYYLDGSVFDTSIPEVADTAFSFTGDIIFEPISYTYTETGWSLRYVPLVAQYLNGPSLSTAMMEAISVSFRQMSQGDNVVIFLPSFEATTASTNVLRARPVYFDITVDRFQVN